MTTVLIVVIGATCALAAVGAVGAHRRHNTISWRRPFAIISAEYAVGVLLGCWPLDAALGPARPILDRLLVGGGA
jgi:hypothetical protein